MGKFKRFPPRTLRFRSLLILAGAFALLAAFTPRANAQGLLLYYNMEGLVVTPPYDVNLDSHPPALVAGPGTTLFMDNGTPGTAYPAIFNVPATGLTANVAPGDPAANLNSLGTVRNGSSDLGLQIRFPASPFTGMYNVTSVSFAWASPGNGFSTVQLQMSTNGGMTFTTNITGVLTLTGTVFTITVPAGTTLNINNLALRLLFSTAQSNGNNLQFQLDNIQINGTIVPEPATVAGGLLGVLGLCWFQRKRLIRSVRFRKA
jgi:hypothetical protein